MLHSCNATGPRSKMRFEMKPDRVGRSMRKPRPGLAWPTGRIHRRAAYCNYVASEQWFSLRDRWVADWVARHGTEPRCLICGVEWALCDDFHPRTHERLGSEVRRDLIPLCRSCHGVVHLKLETDRSWRRLDRAQTMDLVVVKLRRKALKRGARQWARRIPRA